MAILKIVVLLMLLCMASIGRSRKILRPSNGGGLVNVMDYGAIGNAKSDDSKAFLKAWEIVCGSTTSSYTLYVPEGKKFLLKPLMFTGPCKSSNVLVKIMGNIIAPEKSQWSGYGLNNWLVFANIDGLSVYGNGVIDGNGASWWNSCQEKKECNSKRPSALAFFRCTDLKLSGLTHKDSQRNHVSVSSCDKAFIHGLHISAPESSPNTDGINIANSTNILINNCYIGTGDDCISINNGSSNINMSLISCGPGHGISIGSLGRDGSNDEVEEIHVKDSTFTSTQNGVRIKTWKGGSGYARKISFNNIIFIGARNPIIIDQNYCPHEDCPHGSSAAVKISNVEYIGLHGTSADEKAIDLSCDSHIGCSDMLFNHVNITHVSRDLETIASCENAHGSSSNTYPRLNCLLP